MAGCGVHAVKKFLHPSQNFIGHLTEARKGLFFGIKDLSVMYLKKDSVLLAKSVFIFSQWLQYVNHKKLSHMD
ncbi:hypothetical protein RW64_00080 [Geobacter sulfurreducens]|nr:hypothetical protein RW64_00080 [Geobacter sulfurreducens]